MKLLITGFEPFGGEERNASLEAVGNIPDEMEGVTVKKANLPVVFSSIGASIAKEIESWKPDAVLCIGQAGGSAEIAVERIAINLIDARIPDNEGVQPVDIPVKEDGENAYFSTLPVKSIVCQLNHAGIPAKLSFSAGSFVCNALMYETLYLIQKKYPHIKGGFIHVPLLSGQGSETMPSMSLENLVKGIKIAIKTIASGEELSVSMGTLQ